MRKLLATLGLVGLLSGCSQERVEVTGTHPTEIRLWGYVEQRPSIFLSNGLFRPNSLFLDVQLDCSNDYACKDLDLRYHGENGAFRSIHAQLETGENILNLSKGDAVYFALTEGFTQSGRLAVGDPLYWINVSPARGKLLEYFAEEE